MKVFQIIFTYWSNLNVSNALIGFNSNNFYNTCLLIESSLSVELILNKILKIEKDMGRLNSRDQYIDRCIDIDILFVEDIIVKSKDLIIPHPRLHLRKFVLTPSMCKHQ